MKKFYKLFTAIALVGFIFVGLQSCEGRDAKAGSPEPLIKSIAAVDLKSWSHPTNKIFEKYGVTVSAVKLEDNVATFDVIMPFDPQSSENAHHLNELCFELLKANGWWRYSLKSVEDKIEIQVIWNKKNKEMSLDIVPLAN